MVSTLKVQTIQIPNSDSDIITFDTSGNVTLNANKTSTGFGLTSPFATNTTSTSEGGATTTNISQGLAKLWLRYQSSAITDSLNTSSITDLGTVNDNLVVSFTNNFVDKETYCPIGQMRSNIDGPSANPGALRISVGSDTNNCTTSQLGGSIANARADAMLDWVAGQITIHGDLA